MARKTRIPPSLLRAVFTSSSHNSLWPTNLWQSKWPSLTTCIAVSACSQRQRVRASCSQSLGRLTLLEDSTYRAAVASEHALATVAGASVAKRCGPAPMIFKDRQPAFLSLLQHSPRSQSIGQQTTIAPHCQTSLRLEEPFPWAFRSPRRDPISFSFAVNGPHDRKPSEECLFPYRQMQGSVRAADGACACIGDVKRIRGWNLRWQISCATDARTATRRPGAGTHAVA